MADHALAARIKALISFRAVFITLLLGAAYLFRIDDFYEHPRALASLIISLYVLTICYSLLLTRARSLFALAYVQLIVDVLAELWLISITGGIQSWFSFTLILTVLSSSIVLNKKAGYVIASISGILYGALLDLQFYHVLQVPHEPTAEKVFLYNIFVHVLALYLTAYLSGYLSSRLEKTARKLEEKDVYVKDLELFNLKVIESLPSGLFTADTQGSVVMFNRAAEEITGIRRDAIIGRRADSALPFLSFPFVEGRVERIWQNSDQGQKIIGLHMSVLKDAGGNHTGYICIFQDLTHYKTLETEIKAKEKWAAIGELSANIAHEIRNPLASLKGSIEMLKEESTTLKYRDKLMDIALREMERLNNIVTDFLMYSSPRPLERRQVDVHALLDETISLLMNTADAHDTRIAIRKDFSGEMYVSADQQKLRQVFWNLGVNALEAMKGGGELTVTTAPSHGAVHISFSDTGPGIDASDLERIFYPFFTTKEGGTGLGLAIAYRIVEEHNGRLAVKSVPGVQTVFEITLKRGNGNRTE